MHLPIARPSLPPLDEFVNVLRELWETRMLSNFGRYACQFEQRAADFVGNPHVAAVANCDLGLVISLAALELPKGAPCLVPSFTFNSTINSIIWNGLRPVFVDADPETFNADPNDVRRRLEEGAAAIVVTHVFGSPADIEAIMELAKAAGVPVVFDAAHAFGAEYRGKRIGHPSLGALQVFSFSGTKPITAAEGGLIAAADGRLIDRILKLRAYGFRYDYISDVVGLNAKLSELHAALGWLLLGQTEEVILARNRLAAYYRAQLATCPEVSFQKLLPHCRSTFKDFAIVCADGRDELASCLARAGVQTKKYFVPLHTMPAYRRFGSGNDDLADTEALSARVLCLPIFNEMSEGEADRVCETILRFYGRA